MLSCQLVHFLFRRQLDVMHIARLVRRSVLSCCVQQSSAYSHFHRTHSLRLEQSVGPITLLFSSAPHKQAIRRPKYLWASFPSHRRSCYICQTDKPRCHVAMHVLRSSSDGMRSSLVLMNTCVIVATPVLLTVAVK
jgi:hypothetical protein